MEVLERSLRDERCLCWRMKEEEEFFFGKWGPRSRARPCHYRHGPCQSSGFLGFGMASQARACHCRHGPCQASGILGSKIIFLRFLESCSDHYLQNNLKQQKTNKKRLNVWDASHEALV